MRKVGAWLAAREVVVEAVPGRSSASLDYIALPLRGTIVNRTYGLHKNLYI